MQNSLFVYNAETIENHYLFHYQLLFGKTFVLSFVIAYIQFYCVMTNTPMTFDFSDVA